MGQKSVCAVVVIQSGCRALSIQGSSTILDAKIAEQAAKFKSALTSNPGSPGSISRASSFLDGGFKSRLSDVNRLASMKEHVPLDHLQRSNSVSVAEVAHGRVRSPPSRTPTLKPKPRLAKVIAVFLHDPFMLL